MSIKIRILCFFAIFLLNNNFLCSQWQSNIVDKYSQKFLYKSTENFFAITEKGITRSTNNGNFWSFMEISEFIVNQYATTILQIGDRIFVGAGSGFGIYSTPDYGETWQQNLDDKNIYCFLNTGNVIFSGVDDFGIYVSTNSGENWFQRTSGMGNVSVRSLAFDGINIFAGTNGNKIFKTTNFGINWESSNSGLNSNYVFTILFTNGSLFAGTDGGVYQSTNQGINWLKKNNGLTFNTVYCFTSEGTDIYCGTPGGGVFRTSNNGDNWSQINEGLGTNPIRVQSLESFGGKIFTGINTSSSTGVYFKTNSDTIWSELNSGLTMSTSYPIVIHNNEIIVGGPLVTKFFKTKNNGANWQEISFIKGFGSIRCLISKDENLFAGVDRLGIFLSSNSGNNWTTVNSGLTSFQTACLSTKNNILFAGDLDSGIYISKNMGEQWIISNSGLTNKSVKCFMIKDDKVFTGTSNSLFLSLNDGLNWEQINTGFINPNFTSLINVENMIYASTSNHGVLFSSNNGANWFQRNSGITGLNVFTLHFADKVLFANASYNGIYFSTNDGQSWIKYFKGLGSVYAPMANGNFVSKDGYIFSTSGNGVYRCNISDIIVGINNLEENTPFEFTLFQNFPNPFNPSTSIKFEISEKTLVKLVVYDILGKIVKTLVNKEMTSGVYSIDFSAENIPSGIYFYNLETNESMLTKKMVIIK